MSNDFRGADSANTLRGDKLRGKWVKLSLHFDPLTNCVLVCFAGSLARVQTFVKIEQKLLLPTDRQTDASD